MNYSIENEMIKLTVCDHGAEPVSVISKASGCECLWNADPALWGRHAPILFPYTGKLTDGHMDIDGVSYPGKQHGFARDMDHICTVHESDRLEFELQSNEETLKFFPFPFLLRSVFTLEGETVHHTLEVENIGKGQLSFGIGYHPAFKCPFDEQHDTSDYEFRFDHMESPLVIDCRPEGLISGKTYYHDTNITAIPLHDRLFDNDSICMTNLKSKTLGIYEKDSDRSIVCNIGEFPYTLIWSQLSEKIRFVCIEPWHSLPGVQGGSSLWEKQAAAAVLAPGKKFTTTLSMRFHR